EIDNDIGKIFVDDNGAYAIVLYKILTINGDELKSVHSGNTNPIVLPGKLMPYSFLRKKSEG
ncbi:MAG: hypothetical protein RL154_1203, partial [Pseudomonadota bacterium]